MYKAASHNANGGLPPFCIYTDAMALGTFANVCACTTTLTYIKNGVKKRKKRIQNLCVYANNSTFASVSYTHLTLPTKA